MAKTAATPTRANSTPAMAGPTARATLMLVDLGKAGPVSGKLMAALIATRCTPDLLKPFGIIRFYENKLVGEKAAATVSH